MRLIFHLKLSNISFNGAMAESMEVYLSALLRDYDRLTNRPKLGQTDRLVDPLIPTSITFAFLILSLFILKALSVQVLLVLLTNVLLFLAVLSLVLPRKIEYNKEEAAKKVNYHV